MNSPTPVSTHRRQFLKGTAAAVGSATIGFPTIIPSTVLGQNAPSKRVTMGCLGFGTIASSTVPAFLNQDRCQVIAVCDVNKQGTNYGYSGEKTLGRDPGKAMVDKHYGNSDCLTFSDYREMLAREDIDAINISTPDHWHAIQAIDCAGAKKHVYGQKPLAMTIPQGRAMVTAVEKAGITWQTGSQQRSDQKFRLAVELVRNGVIGKIKTVKVGLPGGDVASAHKDFNKKGNQTGPADVPDGFDWIAWQGPAAHRDYAPAWTPLNWRWNFDYSGGQVTDFGAHHIDIAQWGLGRETDGPVRIENPTGEVPDPSAFFNTAVKFHFEAVYNDGVRMIVADKAETGFTGVRWEGEDGWIFADRGKIEASDINLLRTKPDDSWDRVIQSNDHMGNFLDGVLEGQPTVAPIEVAHRSIAVAHLGNHVLRNGLEALDWDPANEEIKDDPEATKSLAIPLHNGHSLG